MCKDKECPYAHPTEVCKHFPHCMYGDKCVNIHPAVNCKFGVSCTRPNCVFQHPTFMNVVNKSQGKKKIFKDKPYPNPHSFKKPRE